MAFIRCPNCQKYVSDNAPACPYCGHHGFREEPSDFVESGAMATHETDHHGTGSHRKPHNRSSAYRRATGVLPKEHDSPASGLIEKKQGITLTSFIAVIIGCSIMLAGVFIYTRNQVGSWEEQYLLDIPEARPVSRPGIGVSRGWVNMHLAQRGGRLVQNVTVQGQHYYSGVDRDGVATYHTYGPQDELNRMRVEVAYPTLAKNAAARNRLAYMARQFERGLETWVLEMFDRIDRDRGAAQTFTRNSRGRRLEIRYDPVKSKVMLVVLPTVEAAPGK